MDYANEAQKKLVDKFLCQLPSDDLWDEGDEWQKAYKVMGLKRYKIDKQGLSTAASIEEHNEVLESSSSKEGRGHSKSLFDTEKEAEIKIQNPEFQELMVVVKTTKSAADAVAALTFQMKKLLPSLQVITGDQGFFM